MKRANKLIIFLAIVCITQSIVIGFIIPDGESVRLQRPDSDIINEAIATTENQTGSTYIMRPLYIETGKHVGFLISVNNSAYLYVGIGEYKSILKEY